MMNVEGIEIFYKLDEFSRFNILVDLSASPATLNGSRVGQDLRLSNFKP